MLQILDTVRDRGSRYAASGGDIADAAGCKAFIATLKSEKKFAKATHNSWAAVLADGSVIACRRPLPVSGTGYNI